MSYIPAYLKRGKGMDREEILRRGKAAKKDEGEEYAENRSRRMGEIGLGIFFILLWIYKTAKGLPGQDLLALFWGYLGLGYIEKYRYYKTTSSLVSAICGMVAAVAFALSYFIVTW